MTTEIATTQTKKYFVTDCDGCGHRAVVNTDCFCISCHPEGHPEEDELDGVFNESVELKLNDDWQTQARGTSSEEYSIYVACMAGSQEPIKTFNDWVFDQLF